jgi:uridine kinase
MVVVLIAGASGSGKSTLSLKIVCEVGAAAVIEMDWYYSHRTKIRDLSVLEVLSAFDIQRLKRDITELITKGTTLAPQYSFLLSRRSKRVKRIKRQPVVIIEGLYALTLKRFLEKQNVTVISAFLECEKNVLLGRRLQRDLSRTGQTRAEIIDQFEKHVYPAYVRYIRKQESLADVAITHSSMANERALLKRIAIAVKEDQKKRERTY